MEGEHKNTYEETRLKNIERNQNFLKEIGLHGTYCVFKVALAHCYLQSET